MYIVITISVNFCRFLLPVTTQVCHLISERINDEFDSAMAASDALHSHLRNEYENGRMLRLLVKMGFMNERPEYTRAPQWSETGDRYVLKLFRDYVFHQALSDGAPVLDAGHVVTALNKLDCGDPEQMLLSSRDNKDLLVVSFTDVRRCLESAFMDLDTQAGQAQGQGPNQATGATTNTNQVQSTAPPDPYYGSSGGSGSTSGGFNSRGYNPATGSTSHTSSTGSGSIPHIPRGGGGLVTYPLPPAQSNASNNSNSNSFMSSVGGRTAALVQRLSVAQQQQPQTQQYPAYGAQEQAQSGSQANYMQQQAAAGAYTMQGQVFIKYLFLHIFPPECKVLVLML